MSNIDWKVDAVNLAKQGISWRKISEKLGLRRAQFLTICVKFLVRLR